MVDPCKMLRTSPLMRENKKAKMQNIKSFSCKQVDIKYAFAEPEKVIANNLTRREKLIKKYHGIHLLLSC